MSDYSELKRLAEAALNDNGDYVALSDYGMAVPPAVVLDLIAKVEGLRAQHGRDSAELRSLCHARDDARKERDQLKVEVERLTADNASLRGSCAKLGVEHAGMVRIHRKANTEIRRLSAEVEALRKDAERYRWLREKVGVDLIFGDYNPWLLSCNTDMTDLEKKTTDAAIDDAMTKGSKP